MAADIEIFIGTSQDFLLSYRVKKTDDDEFALERLIAHRCHHGSIICMDTKGRYLATGGGDDRIVVIDLKLNRDVHEIVCHEGSINTLSFTNKGTDLLSGSDDGRMVATTVGSWKRSSVWKKPHTNKAVLKICLHPTDKFALSLGKDSTLRGWDMLKGTQIATYNTREFSDAGTILDNVEMSPDGNTFVLCGAKTVTLINFERSEPRDDDELTLDSRVTSMCWLDTENVLIGMENGSIEWLNIRSDKNVHINLPNIHPRRIKGMHHLNGFLGTICSNGTISLWAVTVPSKQLTLICSTTDESIRPTCIKLIDITENRYKQQPSIDTSNSTEQLRSTRKLQPVTTTTKLIVETNDNEDEEILSPNQNSKLLDSDDDTDTEVVVIPEKKTTKKKAKVLPIESTPIIEPIQTKRRRSKTPKRQSTTIGSTQKPIVVCSLNSDDDFEKSVPKRNRTEVKQKAQTPIAMRTPKSNSKNQLQMTPVATKTNNARKRMKFDTDGTITPKKQTAAPIPMSCPAVIRQKENIENSMKKRRKIDLNKTEPLPASNVTTRRKGKRSM